MNCNFFNVFGHWNCVKDGALLKENIFLAFNNLLIHKRKTDCLSIIESSYTTKINEWSIYTLNQL